MAKLIITLEVDTILLFDSLKQMGGNCEPLGTRLVSTLLTGNPSTADKIGMIFYGIIHKKTEEVKDG
jgi:hypothetical protein